MSKELVTSFLDALQASISILLIIVYGVLASQFKLLEGLASKQISVLCVRMFLPALLMANIGSQLNADTGLRYVPVLSMCTKEIEDSDLIVKSVWGLFYVLSSMLLGFILTRIFKLPSWANPAISFNNTTGLPLLMVESLQSTGLLDQLLMSSNDTSSKALLRAKSYFLVNAMIGNSLTFAIGPKLLDGGRAPEKKGNIRQNGQEVEHEENGQAHDGHQQTRQLHEDDSADERTSLLPSFVVRGGEAAGQISTANSKELWSLLIWARRPLHFAYAFLHPPLIGAVTGLVIGLVIGLVPPLHQSFFNASQSGGIFTAWLADSIQKIGELFPVLQTFVVGTKLSSSMRKMKRGEESGLVPWTTVTLVTIIRFVMWPVVSICLTYLLVSRTSVLEADSMLWFCMMLIPTGPTAMKLTALADVSGSSENEKMSIAKFLSITYALSPFVCFTVAGALKACHSAMDIS